jgi:serine/threonine-protein kinase RsbW
MANGQALGAARRAGLALCSSPQWLQEIRFAAAVENIPQARRQLATAAQHCGLAGTALFDLLLAVSEAMANAVRHGSPHGRKDEVVVRLGLCAGSVVVEVSDHGPGFLQSPTCPPNVESQTGRGIPFMRALVDDLSFDCAGGGTTVQLLKHVPV